MATKPLDGVRVLEVAQFTFVPSAGAVLADWGADVVKIEHPVTGDAQRGLVRILGTAVTAPGSSFAPIMEAPNRGKRSVGLALDNPDARPLLDELIRGSDVFLTNYLPSARSKLSIDVEDVRGVNPDIIYVAGSGFGFNGPDRDTGAYDATAFWARGGSADGVMAPGNPLTGAYRTSDGRFIQLSMLQPVKYWQEFCRLMDLDEYAEDPRFVTFESMLDNCDAAYEIVCTAIAQLSLAECKKRLSRGTGQWAPIQDAWDLANDDSLIANGRIAEIVDAEGNPRRLVNSPVKFDEGTAGLTRAPQFAEHTDEVIRELGIDDEQLIALKIAGAIT